MESEKLCQICDEVWLDRTAILSGRGILKGEAALVRAVYWRLCKAGAAPAASLEDCAPDPLLLIYQQLVGSALTQSGPAISIAPPP
jgi:hypothetical protein